MASKLEQSFADTVNRLGAHTLSIGYLAVPNGGEPFFSVSVQRWDNNGQPGDKCGSHIAPTIEGALRGAIAEAGLALVLADEALPELAA